MIPNELAFPQNVNISFEVFHAHAHSSHLKEFLGRNMIKIFYYYECIRINNILEQRSVKKKYKFLHKNIILKEICVI